MLAAPAYFSPTGKPDSLGGRDPPDIFNSGGFRK